MKIEPKLEAFLKEEEGALENFKREVAAVRPPEFEAKDISHGFEWEYSKQGAKYWAALAFKYRSYETRKCT